MLVVRGFRCKRIIDGFATRHAYDPQVLLNHEQQMARNQFQEYAWRERWVQCEQAELVTETYDDFASMQTKIEVRWDPGPRYAEFVGGPWHGRPAFSGATVDPYSSPSKLDISVEMSSSRAAYPYDPSAPAANGSEVFVYEFYGWNPKTQHWVYTYGRKTS